MPGNDLPMSRVESEENHDPRNVEIFRSNHMKAF